MDFIQIQGGVPFCGEVSVQGSKNAALPVMAACVLVPGITTLKNCPDISDVSCMCEILRHVGAKVIRQEKTLTIDTTCITQHKLPVQYVTRMRSSVVLAGAMLGRCREIEMAYPGGCVIGDRPIDMHIRALGQLGARFTEEENSLYACVGCLKGTKVALPFPSVGATQNAVMAAVLAQGTTEISGCAREPEVRALCDFLNGAGAKISGGGSTFIRVEGVSKLHESTYTVEPDRIVAGTYLVGTLAAGGSAFLRNAPAGQLESVCHLAGKMGAHLRADRKGIFVERTGALCAPEAVETGTYPAFPTDLQSPFLVALCQAQSQSRLYERIFNGRLAVVGELNRMGACIHVDRDCAAMEGSACLTGCSVMARELRGGAALVLAGACAQGTTLVHNRHFIDRGYEDIVRDLQGLGVNIGGKK